MLITRAMRTYVAPTIHTDYRGSFLAFEGERMDCKWHVAIVTTPSEDDATLM